MKYAIKEEKSNASYVKEHFMLTHDLEQAKLFVTLADAIDVLVLQAQSHPLAYTRFTIVGVKEVIKPTFEEIVL